MIKIKNKKAEGLPLNVIIIAIICLAVLIVVLAIFYLQTGGVATSLGKISKEAGEKAEETQGSLDEFFTCKEGAVKCVGNDIQTCKDGAWTKTSSCEKDKICKDGGCVEKT